VLRTATRTSLKEQRQHWQRLSQIRDPLHSGDNLGLAAWLALWVFLPFQGNRAGSLSFNPVARADGDPQSLERTRRGWQQVNLHAVAPFVTETLRSILPAAEPTPSPF